MIPVKLRLPLLAGGGLSLLAGLYAALVLVDAPVPDTAGGLGQAHGPVMVFGFVGTLMALERAVALGARWGLIAPLTSALGAALLLAGFALAGLLLLSFAGIALLGIYTALGRRQTTIGLLAQMAGALCWYAAALLWLGGFPIPDTIPWLAAFVVLTIAGERLELAHIGQSSGAEPWFVLAVLGVLAGALATVLWPGPGHHLWGLAVLGVAVWLGGYDVARNTARRAQGLPRYVGVALLSGYAWLALAGLLWAGGGSTVDGPRYDATLHAVFLGFTMSMIFAHAPVILPAVLRRPLPYHPVLYAPLALLHLSLAVRLGLGDLAGLTGVWRWSGGFNELAIVFYLACAIGLTMRAGSRTGGSLVVTR